MSWSYNGIGKPKKVYEHAVKQLEVQTQHMSDPENTVVQLFLDQLSNITEAMPENSVIRVSASGSQYTVPPNGYLNKFEAAGIYNNFKVDIEPVYGFVE